MEPCQKAFHPAVWDEVNRRLVAKMISEWSYEEMIHPLPAGENGMYTLDFGESERYTFRAERRLLDRLFVDPESIVYQGGKLRAVTFFKACAKKLKMKPETTAKMIQEFQQTLLADAHIAAKQKPAAGELLRMDYARLEGEMNGHPWITYNKGRIGFSYRDYLAYAPEQKKRVRLSWIAVKRSRAEFQAVAGYDEEQLLRDELDPETRKKFCARLSERGLDASQFLFMPVHMWQWENVIVPHFVEDLAQQRLVWLGDGPDEYLPGQSIRTFANITNQNKHHVKLPMSILNTLVYRGLPAERTVIAPRVTEYIQGICRRDPFLSKECRLITPGEIASINVDQTEYASLKGVPYPYLELLGAVWRESIFRYMEQGEQAIPLSSLLHVDGEGKPFVAALLERSGLTVDAWIKRFFAVVLPPLLHYLYQYGTVFSPHGQNTIVIVKEGKPCRLAVKDYVDDVNISDQPFEELAEMDDDLKKVLRSEPPEGLTQFIFTGLFVCHLRYFSDVLETYCGYSEYEFWRRAKETIHEYQERFSHLQSRFQQFDLFKPKMTKLCLNRNRMLDDGYTAEADRPHASEFGKVSNPLDEVTAGTVR